MKQTCIRIKGPSARARRFDELCVGMAWPVVASPKLNRLEASRLHPRGTNWGTRYSTTATHYYFSYRSYRGTGLRTFNSAASDCANCHQQAACAVKHLLCLSESCVWCDLAFLPSQGCQDHQGREGLVTWSTKATSRGSTWVRARARMVVMAARTRNGRTLKTSSGRYPTGILFFLGELDAACADAKRVSATVPMSRFQKHIPQRLISLHSSGIVLYQYDMYSAPPSFYVSRKIMFIFPFKHSPDILILV